MQLITNHIAKYISELWKITVIVFMHLIKCLIYLFYFFPDKKNTNNIKNLKIII